MAKERSVYGRQEHHRNSVAARINSGDKDFLKKLGLTKEEAKRRLRAYLKETAGDANAMERWYRGVGPNQQGDRGGAKW